MHAYLVVGTNPDSRELEIHKLLQKKGEKVLEFQIEKIKDVRELTNFTKLSLDQPTSILIKNIENATTEALNAFLKSLEEPKKNITFILTSKSEYSLIPTITSRCQIVRATSNPQESSKERAQNFLEMSLGQKFMSLDGIKKKEDALSFLRDLLSSLHAMLIGNSGSSVDIIDLMKASQKTLNNLKMNANVGLQLTNFVVNYKNNDAN